MHVITNSRYINLHPQTNMIIIWKFTVTNIITNIGEEKEYLSCDSVDEI